jgi:hypothetical protein
MKTKIKQVRDFGFHLARKYGMKPPNNAWRDEIPVDDFFLFMEKYIQAHRGIISPSIVNPNPQATVYTPSTPTPKSNVVVDFKKTVKRDKSNYLEFKDEKMWDHFQRNLVIQAQADGISNQLDKNYVPSTPEEVELDKIQGFYFFSVLNHVFLTDKGKSIVRKHMHSFDARAAYAEMVEHMTNSTKAQHKKQELLEFLVTSRFGENVVRTTATHFILTYMEKFRQLDALTPIQDQITSAVRMT